MLHFTVTRLNSIKYITFWLVKEKHIHIFEIVKR